MKNEPVAIIKHLSRGIELRGDGVRQRRLLRGKAADASAPSRPKLNVLRRRLTASLLVGAVALPLAAPLSALAAGPSIEVWTEVDGFAIEGHVPAREIHRLLEERPAAIGLSVPAMPRGAPGMDGAAYGGVRDPYDVLLIAHDGAASIYRSYR